MIVYYLINAHNVVYVMYSYNVLYLTGNVHLKSH